MNGIRAYPNIDVAWDRLAEFLADDFDVTLKDLERCSTYVEAEFERLGESFYVQSVGYLYELTHFHFTSYKEGFFEVVTRAAETLGLSDIADVGAGIGLDAQALGELGHELTLYDFDSPSSQYAGWRLRQDSRGAFTQRPLSALGTSKHDLIYAVDTLEHTADPVGLIAKMFKSGRYVCVNFFEHDTSSWDGKDMHFPQNHWKLLPELCNRGTLLQLAISGATVTTLWEAGDETSESR